jgi:hypothetical protein
MSDKPVMISRFGSTEMLCIVNYLGVTNEKFINNLKGYINSKTPPWWWDKSTVNQMKIWSGFFPSNNYNLELFSKLMLQDIKLVDILGSWLKEESFFDEQMDCKKVMLEDLEPFFVSNPWTKALEGKKVLIVHPFDESIKSQYLNRQNIFDNNLLPDFELITLRAVQSVANESTNFKNWFEALDWMKNEIEKIDFDICILGCGAYGLPLAAHVKRIGKKANHLGGVTQLLFGIKGKRWENYVVYPYTNLFNKYWVRPSFTEKPQNANLVEGATYW